MYSDQDQRLYEMLSVLDHALVLFEDDHITQSVAMVVSVKEQMVFLSPDAQNIIREALQSHRIIQLENLGNCVTSFLNFLNDPNQWDNKEVISDSAEISTSNNEATGVHYFKITGVLYNVRMVSVFGALLENDLFGSWMPCCGSSKAIPAQAVPDTSTGTSTNTGAGAVELDTAEGVELNLNSTKRIIRSVFEMLMFKREALFYGIGDVLPNGDVFIFIKSLPEDALPETPSSNSGSDSGTSSIPRVKLEGGFLLKQPESQQLLEGPDQGPPPPIQVEIAFSFDPLVDFLPKWILNFCIKQVTRGLIPMLQQQAMQFEPGQKYYNRIVYGLGPQSPPLPATATTARHHSSASSDDRGMSDSDGDRRPECMYNRIEERIQRTRRNLHSEQQREQRVQELHVSAGRNATTNRDCSNGSHSLHIHTEGSSKQHSRLSEDYGGGQGLWSDAQLSPNSVVTQA